MLTFLQFYSVLYAIPASWNHKLQVPVRLSDSQANTKIVQLYFLQSKSQVTLPTVLIIPLVEKTYHLTRKWSAELNYKHNIQKRITNLKTTLNFWKQRKLSPKWENYCN